MVLAIESPVGADINKPTKRLKTSTNGDDINKPSKRLEISTLRDEYVVCSSLRENELVKVALDFFFALETGQGPDAVLPFCTSPDACVAIEARGEFNTMNIYAAHLVQIMEGCPDMRFIIRSIGVNAKQVSILASWQGHHLCAAKTPRGTMLPASPPLFSVGHYTYILDFEEVDGSIKVAALRKIFDLYAAFSQVGWAIPPALYGSPAKPGSPLPDFQGTHDVICESLKDHKGVKLAAEWYKAVETGNPDVALKLIGAKTPFESTALGALFSTVGGYVNYAKDRAAACPGGNFTICMVAANATDVHILARHDITHSQAICLAHSTNLLGDKRSVGHYFFAFRFGGQFGFDGPVTKVLLDFDANSSYSQFGWAPISTKYGPHNHSFFATF